MLFGKLSGLHQIFTVEALSRRSDAIIHSHDYLSHYQHQIFTVEVVTKVEGPFDIKAVHE
jgi:hypothetical protein